MGDRFVIDEPTHKRWWLPDGRHQFDHFIYGDELYISVIDSRTMLSVLKVPPIKLDDKGMWKEHAELAQELANKRFRSQRLRDSVPRVLSGPSRVV